jgi:hypothetical protein
VTGRVTVRMPGRGAGRRRGRPVGPAVAPGGPDAPQSPPPGRVPRVARVLALAHHWQGLIRSGVVRDQADLARLVGVSRARVTQVMSLLWLAPDIQEDILLPPYPGPLAAFQRHRALILVAADALWASQRRTWHGPIQIASVGAD